MQVSNPNNIKIYNLSCGKSLPEFISEKKRRSLIKKDAKLRHRIELIQDFSMPTVSNCIDVSPDGQYIFCTGTYKPRVRCYDVNQLSLKFERCLDAEAIKFKVLSEDYSKVVFLLNDRTIEFHTQQGKHYRIRIPKFGRDMAYNSSNCDLMLVGDSPEIYRLNLEQGRFFKPFETSLTELNTCVISEDHYLTVAGGNNGIVECWDPRSQSRVGMLDCGSAVDGIVDNSKDSLKVTSLKFDGPLNLAVGTSLGHVLLYDLRNNKPYLTKDHRYDLPIHSIFFNKENDMVISSDERAVKLWSRTTGEAVTAVEIDHDINDMHLVNETGLFFLANESPKLSTFFIPMLGPAPKWCSFLDSLTEEMEENPNQEIYDDYKFLTKKDTEALGLSNLIGTSLLKAYMHGYFVDMRLYHKAVAVANPFAYKEYRQKKISEKMEEARTNRVKLEKRPKVNRELANRLMAQVDDEASSGKQKAKQKRAGNLLQDSRFSAMFQDPSFQVDTESEDFRLLNPVITKKYETLKPNKQTEDSDEEQTDDDGGDVSGGDSDSSSEDELNRRWIKDIKPTTKSSKSKNSSKHENRIRNEHSITDQPIMFEVKTSDKKENSRFSTLAEIEKHNEQLKKKLKRSSESTFETKIRELEGTRKFGKRSKEEHAFGAKEATMQIKSKKKTEREDQMQEHFEERRKVRRSAKHLGKRLPSKPGGSKFFKKF